MFCPSCGKEIPDHSRYCLACGKSPTATISKSAEQHVPEQKSNTRRNILLGFLGILIVVLVIKEMSSRNGESLFKTPRRDPITPAVFTVGAGQMYFVRFNVDGSARVVGRFEVSGGGGNDIEAVITDADDFENWKNGHQSRVLYQSGKTTIGNINVPIIEPGTYYLAFNNQFSMLSSKTISASIVLHH